MPLELLVYIKNTRGALCFWDDKNVTPDFFLSHTHLLIVDWNHLSFFCFEVSKMCKVQCVCAYVMRASLKNYITYFKYYCIVSNIFSKDFFCSELWLGKARCWFLYLRKCITFWNIFFIFCMLLIYAWPTSKYVYMYLLTIIM